jgi:hypothetical protein
MPNAGVQPQIRAQREFVGWNALLACCLLFNGAYSALISSSVSAESALEGSCHQFLYSTLRKSLALSCLRLGAEQTSGVALCS